MMHYIILDLEWNNTYARKNKGFINEIIEIGAVMLNDNLDTIKEFSCLIKPQISKRLRSNIKQLTHITNDDVRNGIPFNDAMSEFNAWIGDEENVILTWGDGDIRVLIENYKYLNSITTIPFLENYIDIQHYFQIKMKMPLSKQIGLFNAAEAVGINPDDFSHHRALDDSLLTADCFRKVFDKADFFDSIKPCNEEFYKKLFFKPRVISNINNSLVDRDLLNYKCDKCGVNGKLLKGWKFSNQYFRAIYQCPECGQKVRVAVRFKKYFDRLETKKNVSIITENDSEKKIETNS
ncbi:MAG: exonuclease domain-containing protein [Ruminococcus sp.]|nr:exonuclease domain-containing protein [Candidatus Copronaster equi]